MAREFYVFKVGKREDSSQPHITLDNNGRIGEPARAQPVRARGRPFGGIEEAQLQIGPRNDAPEQAPLPDPGYGFVIQREDRKDMDTAFTTREAAEAYAKHQAECFPKTLFGVFSCDVVFETTTPSVIEKKYNDAGELLVVQK
jgi:hypothetical protein